MSYIFISYSKQNHQYAYPLAEFLEQAGFPIWIDRSDIEFGMKWWEAIEQGITDCAAMIVLMSPESKSSEWVEKEIFMGLELKKPFFPMLLNGKRWNLFNTIQFIDVTHQGMPDENFLKRLNQYVKPKKQSAVPILQAIPQPPRAKVLDILPQPFEWVTIPQGKVTLATGSAYEVPAFQIAKYPITNAQYQVFVSAKDGYADARWWDFLKEAGEWRKANANPQNTGFTGDLMPRTNVTWYEAIAFCWWLGGKTGENVTLPTERQWQRAAQGDDGREYPWGNGFDKSRCNTNESGLKTTTPVTQYPTGASPYGVMDMEGNVREWCLSEYDKPDMVMANTNNTRSLRGGSWLNTSNYTHVSARGRSLPSFRLNSIGFRVCLLF